MDSDDRELLLRTAKLAEDNNRRLRRIERNMFWSQIWGIIKVALIVVPLILGYFYLEPHLGSLGESLREAKQLMTAY